MQGSVNNTIRHQRITCNNYHYISIMAKYTVWDNDDDNESNNVYS